MDDDAGEKSTAAPSVLDPNLPTFPTGSELGIIILYIIHFIGIRVRRLYNVFHRVLKEVRRNEGLRGGLTGLASYLGKETDQRWSKKDKGEFQKTVGYWGIPLLELVFVPHEDALSAHLPIMKTVVNDKGETYAVASRRDWSGFKKGIL